MEKRKRNKTKQSYIFTLSKSSCFCPTSSPSPACKGGTQSAKSTGGKFQSYTREYIQYRYIYIYIYSYFSRLQLHSFYCSCHAGSPLSATTSCLMSPTAKLLKYFTTSQEQRDECERVQNHLGRPREESLVLVHLKVLWTFAGI